MARKALRLTGVGLASEGEPSLVFLSGAACLAVPLDECDGSIVLGVPAA